MENQGNGFILSTRQLGESGVIVNLLTQELGTLSGYIHITTNNLSNNQSSYSKSQRQLLQVGNHVSYHWRARDENQLGRYKLEGLRDHSGRLMTLSGPLAALVSSVTLLDNLLPERLCIDHIFDNFQQLLAKLEHEDWLASYSLWEIGLLSHLGFGLDLSACVLSGEKADLAYISPKSGRAVSKHHAGIWKDKLFPLPQALLDHSPMDNQDIIQCLTISGHFLDKHILAPANKKLPADRSRLLKIAHLE